MEASASVCGSLSVNGRAVSFESAEAKGRRALVDAHQSAPHQRLQRGRRQILAPQLGERQFAAAGRQLGENGLLLFGQRGQTRLGNQHGEALGAARIALDGRGLARDPFLAQHAGQHRQAWRQWRCAAWRP